MFVLIHNQRQVNAGQKMINLISHLSEVQEFKKEIEGMHCTSCAMNIDFSFGAGNENRTRVLALARQCNSHYTIPAGCGGFEMSEDNIIIPAHAVNWFYL